MNWYLQVLKKYAVFSGRARRTEYWMFTLVNLIVAFVLGMLLAFTGIFGTVISYLYSLAVLIPSLAVERAEAARYGTDRMVAPHRVYPAHRGDRAHCLLR
jgi:hypothetical protein